MNPAPIAYFCAEYGLQANLPIYAGGLGVLAGDTLKAAADLQQSMTAIGLLYRGKKAKQKIDQQGRQIEVNQDFDPVEVGLSHVYHQGEPLFIKVHLKDHLVWARVWKKKLAKNTTLYLLDSNTYQNQPQDREINDALYFGDQLKQLQQQFLLGIGGAKLLHKLKIKPKVYHLNEGRPVFAVWQLILDLMREQNIDYFQALTELKQQLVYTNHTLVAAGNYFLSVDRLAPYARFYARQMKISTDELLAPGLGHQQAEQAGFSVTDYCLQVAGRHSAVSQLHGQLCQELWPEYDWQPITNGVHMPTWQDQRLRQLEDGSGISNQELWSIHLDNKQQLRRFVYERTGFDYNHQRLVIGWARRLAGYKRLDAVFADVERLSQIMTQQFKTVKGKGESPGKLSVQLLVAGKAHQEDERGKEMLHQVIKIMSDQLAGHALFIPDYNLEVARYLVRGCDVWLNIPERGKEACGTSGMKALSNGVLQCTTRDGWADEVDWTDVGWTLNSNRVSSDFYHTLETKIIPLFQEVQRCQAKQDQPEQSQSDLENQSQTACQWLQMMRRSIQLSQQFSARRMLDQYRQRLYQS